MITNTNCCLNDFGCHALMHTRSHCTPLWCAPYCGTPIPTSCVFICYFPDSFGPPEHSVILIPLWMLSELSGGPRALRAQREA